MFSFVIGMWVIGWFSLIVVIFVLKWIVCIYISWGEVKFVGIRDKIRGISIDLFWLGFIDI